MRILIADKLAPEGAACLASQPGVEVETRTGLTGNDLAGALREAEGVVVRSAVQITGEILEGCMADAGSRLRAIARAGVGVDNIDLPSATRHGVAVMNSASASTITTAEHAFALMIALARNIGPAHATMAAGGWDRGKDVGAQLHGRKLGIVGVGRIGRTLAERAIAFGMEVVGFDPFVNAESVLDGRVPMRSSFDELIAEVDFVSFHVPRSEATVGMLSSEQFALARPGLMVVNAARGGIVDEAALLEALQSDRCGGAALDVFPQEPPPADSPLRNHPKVLLTPHLGASTVEAQEAVAVDACRALLEYLQGRGLTGAVNAGGLQMDLSPRQQRFADLAQRMVALLTAAVPRAGISRVRTTVRGEAPAGRADTIARFGLAGLLQAHLDQPVNVINAAVIAEDRGIDHQTIVSADQGEERISIEIADANGTHRVDGAIFADGLPRVTNLDGHAMDMVPAGPMVLLMNADEPGRIGLVGQCFGDAGVNIAEMVIGRRRDSEPGAPAMMIIKLDQPPTDALLEKLRAADGILSVTPMELADVPGE